MLRNVEMKPGEAEEQERERQKVVVVEPVEEAMKETEEAAQKEVPKVVEVETNLDADAAPPVQT